MEKSHVGMALCFFCGEPKEILLDRRLKNSLVREAIYDYEPCNKCKKWMEKGIILISAAEDSVQNHPENPYRTGGWVVVTEEALSKFPMSGKLKDKIIEKRFSFVSDKVWDYLGLPREEGEK